MTNNKLQKRFKPNVVYELLIHGIYHYAGCHCTSRNYLYASAIINDSGNYLARARDNGFITLQEYRECVELVNVWEFDTKEEAQNFETLKIQELREKYSDLCKNKALYGNQNSTKGCSFTRSEEYKRKLSETNKGRHLSEEAKRKMSESRKGLNTWSKGRHWYTNDTINVCETKCPEGFHPGRTKSS